ncbi:hypothetical protein C8R45DRAFT_1108695 [Mycena sanguinolenta]|nr:hypothetical protein C8R45DRAFT_1108695 [Mycena sanguinolenta]
MDLRDSHSYSPVKCRQVPSHLLKLREAFPCFSNSLKLSQTLFKFKLHPVTHLDADRDVWTETRYASSLHGILVSVMLCSSPSTHASAAVELECTCCGTEWHRTVNVAPPQDRFSLFNSVQWYFQATCVTNESHPVRLMCSLADGALVCRPHPGLIPSLRMPFPVNRSPANLFAMT